MHSRYWKFETVLQPLHLVLCYDHLYQTSPDSWILCCLITRPHCAYSTSRVAPWDTSWWRYHSLSGCCPSSGSGTTTPGTASMLAGSSTRSWSKTSSHPKGESSQTHTRTHACTHTRMHTHSHMHTHSWVLVRCVYVTMKITLGRLSIIYIQLILVY